MIDDSFERELRTGLATLAREAVPDGDTVVLDDLPRVQHLTSREQPRLGRRALAAAVAVVVIAGSVAVAVAIATHGKRSTLVQSPPRSWTSVANGPLAARSSQSTVFTGRDVIIWGGRSDAVGSATTPPVAVGSRGPGPRSTNALADGAAYDVHTGRWRTLQAAPIGARYEAVSVWTGTEMIVVGGKRDGTGTSGATELLRDGAAYNPLTDRWRRIPDAPGCPAFGTWSGARLVVANVCANGTRSFAAFDPTHDVWTTIAPAPEFDQLASAGGRVYAWSGSTNRGAVLDASTGRWSDLAPLQIAPQTLGSIAIAYDGNELAVVGMERSSSGRDLVAVAILSADGRGWRHYESDFAGPPVTPTAASDPGLLLWSQDVGFGGFGASSSVAPFEMLHIDRGPIALDRTGESLVGIGGRRFFVWGGRLAGSDKDPTNRPTADGAILELP